MTLLAWTLVALALIAGLIWLALAARLVALHPEPRLEPPAGPLPADLPLVTAIMAARNEERDVEAALVSVLDQEYPGLALIVVDDQSTDGTSAILSRLKATPAFGDRLKVISGDNRPPGWVGKTWAVTQGVGHASAPWLWFVDADMTLHPRALLAAVLEGLDHEADLVSLFPRADCRTFWQGATALMLAQILGHFYPTKYVNDSNRPEALAAGGFLLVRRSAYDRAGGHEAVRSEIVEDIQLARRIKANGGRLRVRPAPHLASTHMYGSLGEIWRGLRKNAYAGMEYQFHKYAFGSVIALIVGGAGPVSLLAGLAMLVSGDRHLSTWAALAAGAFGWSAEALASWPLARFLRLGLGACWSMPAGIALYVAIATSSVWHHHRGRILWKGRAYAPAEVAPVPHASGLPASRARR